jgi:hypothetical protein
VALAQTQPRFAAQRLAFNWIGQWWWHVTSSMALGCWRTPLNGFGGAQLPACCALPTVTASSRLVRQRQHTRGQHLVPPSFRLSPLLQRVTRNGVPRL